MAKISDIFLGRGLAGLPGEAVKARRLYFVNWMLIAVYILLWATNLLSGALYMAVLPTVCAALTALSQFLIIRGSHRTAAWISLGAFGTAMGIGLFLGREATDAAMLFRGALSFFFLIAAAPLVSTERLISLKMAAITMALLGAAYAVRILPARGPLMETGRAETTDIVLALSVASLIAMLALLSRKQNPGDVELLTNTRRKGPDETLLRRHDIAVALVATADYQEAMDIIMNAAMEVDGVDSGGIYIRNAVTGIMTLRAHRGLSSRFVESASVMPPDSSPMNVIGEKKPAFTNSRNILEFLDEPISGALSAEELEALAAIPIFHEGEIVGALNCASHVLKEFSEDTRLALSTLAAMAGPVMYQLRAAEALRESEKKYRELVEKGNNLIFTTDGQGYFTYISPFILGLAGYEPEEVIGKPFSDFVYSEDLARITAKYQELFKGVYSPDEYRVVTKSGGVRWILSNSQAIMEDGKLTGIVGMFTDITERRNAEEERLEMERRLLHAQKLESLGVLTGGIAHDFNNLLMAMMGNLELASFHIDPKSEGKPFMDEAVLASRRAADLIKQMLAYSGRVAGEFKLIRLNDVVEEITTLIRSSVTRKAVLKMRLEKDPVSVKADPTQIQQIVMNLIVNASEALDEETGSVTIAVGDLECDAEYLAGSYLKEKPSPGRYAYVEVADTGHGMDKDTLSRLFDPFFTTKFAGRGLGMAAVLGIVKGHGGAFMVDSTPGAGTTVRVLFPAAAEDMESPVDSVMEERNEAASSQATVLLVDDDPMVLTTTNAMLRRMGFETIVAARGRDALNMLRSGPPVDCAIIDLTMPDIDGCETASEIKKILPSIPIILSSGYPREEVLMQDGKCGSDGFIQKPYRLEALKKEIARVLKRNQ